MPDYNIHIKSLNRKVYFEIFDNMGNSVSRSINYHSICDLENGLRNLSRFNSGAQIAKFDRGTDLVTFASAHSRHKISLITTFSAVEAINMLTQLPPAKIIDVRQSRKLRTNLTGHLSDFN
jgi:hypothetical protein